MKYFQALDSQEPHSFGCIGIRQKSAPMHSQHSGKCRRALRKGVLAVFATLVAVSFCETAVSLATAQDRLLAQSDDVAPPDGVIVNELEAEDASDAEVEADAEECTPEKLAKLKKQVATAYKGVYYDNDFSYLCDPCYCDWHLGEELKRNGWGCCVLDVGGEYRTRYHHEDNMRGLLFLARDDDFLLHRWRLYGNLEIGEHTRAYVEYLDAVSNYEDFAPRGIEENRSDLLNAFIDVRLLDNCACGELTARVGRQELLYGEQRLISPLDWANTRRTFEGAKAIWIKDQWRADAFWMRPVLPDVHNFDQVDENQEFYGIWATHKEGDTRTLDLYWLGRHDYDSPYVDGRSYKFQTCGARHHKKYDQWQTLLQGGYQFGDFGDFDHSAGFYVAGLGRTWECHCWKPTLWLYYDWASGDEVIGNGFNQLFPLAHKYLGFMDLFARTNIEDVNVQWTAQPCENLTLLVWWHCFWLQNGNDVPYTVIETPYVTTPGGSRYLGQEIDILLTWKLKPRTELLIGYSHFFTGDWFRTNPEASLGSDADANFVYVQFSQQF